MDNQESKNHARLAASLVLVVAIGASLIGAVYLRNSQNNASTSSGVGTTSSIQMSASLGSAQGTPLGLKLALHISTNATGALSIFINETNLLNRVNNVTTANRWPYPNTASQPCGNWAQFPIEYAVLQGHYGTSDYTSASAFTVYDTSYFYTCPTVMAPIPYLLFAPLSDNSSRFYSPGQEGNLLVSASYSVAGYWTGSGNTASFHQFPPGVYTVLAEDEWGTVILLPFTVHNNSISIGSSSSASSGPVTLSTRNSDWKLTVQLNATAISAGQTISFMCYLTNISARTQTVVVASPLCNGPTIYTQGGQQVWEFETSATNAAQTISARQTISGYQVNIPTSELQAGHTYILSSYPNVLTDTNPEVFFGQWLQANATITVG